MQLADRASQPHRRADPRSRSLEGWRATKAVLASRGEVNGPRVAEAAAGLEFWKFSRRLDKAVTDGLLTREFADAVVDVAARSAQEGEPQQTSEPSQDGQTEPGSEDAAAVPPASAGAVSL